MEILDPAAGTGTFVCELLERFRGQPAKMAWKYENEIHANEVAILPYYVANLNIEATYSQITKTYAEFPSLCFVDTLDNVQGLGIRRGHQHDLLAALSDKNVERVKRQNRAKISVVLGNPPYNANQQNENDDNKNRKYPHIDLLIKSTYIKQSSAQKTKLYDMYTRFFRWATDRLGDEGVIAFISNNSFVKKANYDGFRKIAAEQFCDVYIIDFKGDARTSGEPRKKEGDNIFENAIKVGIAISFLVRKTSSKGCAIHYAAVHDYAKLDEKRAFIAGKTLGDIAFETIKPDSKHNWVGLTDNDWNEFPSIASKATKKSKTPTQIRAIFKDYALGISTNRDEWLYGFDKDEVVKKATALIKAYGAVPTGARTFPNTLKWSETLKRHLKAGKREKFNPNALRKANYRPFVPRWLYQSNLFIDRTGGLDDFFPLGKDNKAICFSDVGSRTGSCILAIDQPADLHFGAAIDGYQQVPLYIYSSHGERVDNVTDWALRLFEKTYGTAGLLSPSRAGAADPAPIDSKPKKGGRPAAESRKLTKESIFNYVYAVLYDPSYRQRYALNLRREFPRIPFYEDFWTWSDWGRDLVAMHTGFDGVTPWPLTRTDKPPKEEAAPQPAKAMLKASKDKKSVLIDSVTTLSGIPQEAWTYQLGNRSALAWVLEQHKEKKPKDPVVAASFNTYRLADIKEDLVSLIGKVCQVSVGTVKITEAMELKAQAATPVS